MKATFAPVTVENFSVWAVTFKIWLKLAVILEILRSKTQKRGNIFARYL